MLGIWGNAYNAYLDNWNASVNYSIWDKVIYNSFEYIAINDNKNSKPKLLIDWEKTNSSFINEAEQWYAIDDFIVYDPLTSSSPLWESSPKDWRLPSGYVIGDKKILPEPEVPEEPTPTPFPEEEKDKKLVVWKEEIPETKKVSWLTKRCISTDLICKEVIWWSWEYKIYLKDWSNCKSDKIWKLCNDKKSSLSKLELTWTSPKLKDRYRSNNKLINKLWDRLDELIEKKDKTQNLDLLYYRDELLKKLDIYVKIDKEDKPKSFKRLKKKILKKNILSIVKKFKQELIK